MVVIRHPVPREEHVVRVEIARWREVRIAVELDTFAQLERVHLPIGRCGPRFGKSGHDVRRAGLELDQSIEHRNRYCIERCSGREKLRLKTLGTAFRTVDERAFGVRAGREHPSHRNRCG